MGFSINLNGVRAPSFAPIYTAITSAENLSLLVRATSPKNLIDLSSDNHRLKLLNAELTPAGIKTFGGKGSGVEVEGLTDLDFESYTLSAVIKPEQNIAATTNQSNMIVSNWQTTNDALAFLIRVDYDPALKKWSRYLRAVIPNLEDGAVGRVLYDLLIDTGVSDQRPQLSWDVMFVMFKVDITNESTVLTLAIPSHNLSRTTTYNSTYDFSTAARKAAYAILGNTAKNIQVGGNIVDSNFDSKSHQITIKEARIDSAALTDQQISDQYQATKRWLKAEGVVDVSNWT